VGDLEGFMNKEADLLVYNASELVTLARPHGRPHVGEEMQDLSPVPGGAVAIVEGRVAAVGCLEDVRDAVTVGPRTRLVDAGGRLVTPGLVDAHTHLVFAGSREEEFVLKVVEGLSYEAIEERGGGIPVTVAHTRSASADQLLRQARPVISRMFSSGTTTIEAKSGYALEPEGEIKLLEVIQALDLEGPAECVPTFFGTHSLPAEYTHRPDRFLKLVVEEMIPAVAKRGLARFCDSGTALPVDQTEVLYATAQKHGLRIKVHADEFRAVGGAELAAKWKATSAEHCICSSDEGIEAMAASGVIAVLLPGVPLVHRLPQAADGRRFIRRGMAVALGTDFNPSCLIESMSLVLSLGCYTVHLSPAEALTAATINGAYATGCGEKVGSLEVGKQADLVIWEVSNHKQLAERVGGNIVAAVMKKGRLFFMKEGG
jgi:imidazolonepropionase